MLCVIGSKDSIIPSSKLKQMWWHHMKIYLFKMFETPTKINYCGKAVCIVRHKWAPCEHSLCWPRVKTKKVSGWECVGPDPTFQQTLQLNFKTYITTNEVRALHINKPRLQSQPSLPTSNINTRLTPMPFLWETWECPGSNCSCFPRG